MKKLFYFRMGFYVFIGLVSLLVLSFACYGQIVITTTADGELHKQVIRETLGSIDTPQTDSNPHDFYSDTTAINTAQLENYVPAKKLSLKEKLLLYAQECWEDSTETQGAHIKINGAQGCETAWIQGKGFIEEICITPSHYVKKYIHRKPTFEGFIEWLKKK